MPTNIEIKARLDNLEAFLPAIALLADEGPDHILQDDTFFTCDNGRLKLRVIDNRRGSGRSPGCRYEWPRHKTMTGKNALSASVCACHLLVEQPPCRVETREATKFRGTDA
jgi:hypothetical protein